MTDLVSQLVAQLEDMRGKVIELCQTYGNALPHWSLERTDAALTAAKAGGWLPIETAPKDGTVMCGLTEAKAWERHHLEWVNYSQEMKALLRRARRQAQATKPEPMSRDDLKVLMSESGYVHVTAQEKADFINGFRHAEAHHGITSTSTKEQA